MEFIAQAISWDLIQVYDCNCDFHTFVPSDIFLDAKSSYGTIT